MKLEGKWTPPTLYEACLTCTSIHTGDDHYHISVEGSISHHHTCIKRHSFYHVHARLSEANSDSCIVTTNINQMYTLFINRKWLPKNDNGPVTFYIYNMKGVTITQLIKSQNE